MTTSLRHTATWLFLALATCATSAFAQNAAPKPAAPGPAVAATTPTGYGAPMPAPVDRRAAQRTSEQALLGAPPQYSGEGMKQGDTDDAQRTTLLNEQRMSVTGGAGGAGLGAQGGPARRLRKAPAVNGQMNGQVNGQPNGQARVAGRPGRPNAADGLMPQGAAKAAYADPYDTGKHGVYRSPW